MNMNHFHYCAEILNSILLPQHRGGTFCRLVSSNTWKYIKKSSLNTFAFTILYHPFTFTFHFVTRKKALLFLHGPALSCPQSHEHNQCNIMQRSTSFPMAISATSGCCSSSWSAKRQLHRWPSGILRACKDRTRSLSTVVSSWSTSGRCKSDAHSTKRKSRGWFCGHVMINASVYVYISLYSHKHWSQGTSFLGIAMNQIHHSGTSCLGMSRWKVSCLCRLEKGRHLSHVVSLIVIKWVSLSLDMLSLYSCNHIPVFLILFLLSFQDAHAERKGGLSCLKAQAVDAGHLLMWKLLQLCSSHVLLCSYPLSIPSLQMSTLYVSQLIWSNIIWRCLWFQCYFQNPSVTSWLEILQELQQLLELPKCLQWSEAFGRCPSSTKIFTDPLNIFRTTAD